MNVNQYFIDGNKVFNSVSGVTLFTESELQFMNNLFFHKYKFLKLDVYDEININTLFNSLVSDNINYYTAIKDSYEVVFDTLVRTDIRDANTYVKNGDTYLTSNGNNDVTNTLTNIGTVTNANTGTNSNLETTNMTLAKSNTNNMNDKKNTFDNNTLTTVGENITTDTGSDVNTGTINNEETIDNTNTETLNTTNTTVIDGSNSLTENGENNESMDGSNHREGFDNIDYETAIREIYSTRKINLYDIVIDSMRDLITIPIYDFENEDEYIY